MDGLIISKPSELKISRSVAGGVKRKAIFLKRLFTSDAGVRKGLCAKCAGFLDERGAGDCEKLSAEDTTASIH